MQIKSVERARLKLVLKLKVHDLQKVSRRKKSSQVVTNCLKANPFSSLLPSSRCLRVLSTIKLGDKRYLNPAVLKHKKTRQMPPDFCKQLKKMQTLSKDCSQVNLKKPRAPILDISKSDSEDRRADRKFSMSTITMAPGRTTRQDLYKLHSDQVHLPQT